MQFCEDHWAKLRAAIADVGLSTLVSEGGEEVARKLQDEIERGPTLDNFDPLMSAHNAIIFNATKHLENLGRNPLAMFAPELPDHLACPICHLNHLYAEHDRTCKDATCQLERGKTWDWMIDRAANDALEAWQELKL